MTSKSHRLASSGPPGPAAALPALPFDHLICDLFAQPLPAAGGVEPFLAACAQAVGAHVLEIKVFPFPNGGVTGIAVLTESHITVHTWPERGYAALDVFTCSPGGRTGDVLRVIEAYFRPSAMQVRHVDRSSGWHPELAVPGRRVHRARAERRRGAALPHRRASTSLYQ